VISSQRDSVGYRMAVDSPIHLEQCGKCLLNTQLQLLDHMLAKR